MPSSVCQGLDSCLEPWLVEPQVSRLKMVQPKSNLVESLEMGYKPCDIDSESENTKLHNNVDIGGWKFLQSIAGNDCDNNSVYVHPLVKNSSSKLSEKSLEMCTESLGSETGSDGSECSDDISLLSLETENSYSHSKHTPKIPPIMSKKLKIHNNFPPPLTSISGSAGIQVRPHREHGRLVLKAMAVSASNTCFQADRSHGRLRLRLLRESCVEFEEEEDEIEEQEEDVYFGANNGNIGGEIEIGKFPGRIRRCKQGRSGNKALLNFEQFWVAT